MARKARKGLTRRQADVLKFIQNFIDDNGISPTLHEIGEGLGVGRVTAFGHIQQLLEKGWIRNEPHLSRSITLVDPPAQLASPSQTEAFSTPSNAPKIPILGRIAAGQPIDAIEDRETFDINGFFPSDRDCYMLRVQGESMIEDQIRDGDFVLVESRETAHPGETVVALIEDQEATLKRYYPMGSSVRLEPRNATMEPIIVSKRDLRIQGVVIGVLRRY